MWRLPGSLRPGARKLALIIAIGLFLPGRAPAHRGALASPSTSLAARADTVTPVLDRLLQGGHARQFRIGSLSGPDALGLVESVAAGRDGRFYVLDSRSHRLRMYGPEGDLLHAVGGQGQGPGEFSSPEDLAITRDGRILVVDRSRRVEVFLRSGDRLRHENRFRLRSTPWDACVLDGHLVIQAVAHGAGTTIDVYDLDGNRLRSFGEMTPGETLIEGETFSWGTVACLTGGRILYVPQFSDRVALYTLAGDRLWRTEMPDYSPVTVEELSGDRRSFQWTSPEGTHRALRAVALPGGRVAAVHLVLRDTTSTGRHDVQGRRTLFFDVDSGDLLADTRQLPLFDAISRERFFAVRQLPFPTVTAYRLDTRKPAAPRGGVGGLRVMRPSLSGGVPTPRTARTGPSWR